MFQESLGYLSRQQTIIFFVDKDFDYISVLEEVFEDGLVLLCNVHIARYFCEKVFTNKAFWGDPKDAQYLGRYDKDNLIEQVISVRDAPSDDTYRERETKLLELTEKLTIGPSQVSEPILFTLYYEKNWKVCSFCWVRAY